MDSQKRRDVISVIVRLVLLGLSLASWVVALVGVVLIYLDIKRHAKDSDSTEKLVGIQKALNLPYLLFVVGAVPTFLLTATHLIFHYRNKNRAHIIHSIMMAYQLLFIAAGGASIFVGVGYILGGSVIQNILRVNLTYVKIALNGTVSTLTFQWISSFIWPLFNFERYPYRAEYQELEESTNFK